MKVRYYRSKRRYKSDSDSGNSEVEGGEIIENEESEDEKPKKEKYI